MLPLKRLGNLRECGETERHQGVAYGPASRTQTQKGGSKARVGSLSGGGTSGLTAICTEAKNHQTSGTYYIFSKIRTYCPSPGQRETHLKFACLMMTVTWGVWFQRFSSYDWSHTWFKAEDRRDYKMDLNWSKQETNWSKQKLEKEGKKTCFRSALCSCWRLTVKETKLWRWRPAGLHPLSTPGISDRELIHLCLDVLIPANAHLTSAILDPQKPELQDKFLQALV